VLACHRDPAVADDALAAVRGQPLERMQRVAAARSQMRCEVESEPGQREVVSTSCVRLTLGDSVDLVDGDLGDGSGRAAEAVDGAIHVEAT